MKPREPIADPWRYAYHITGEKKIGKTTFSIEGCNEFVLQCDKPQLAYAIKETMVEDWKHSMKIIELLEELAYEGKLPYSRIIVDNVAEWYQMCYQNTCDYYKVESPGDEDWGRGWNKLKQDFLDAVNTLLQIQDKAECGLVFISHSVGRS